MKGKCAYSKESRFKKIFRLRHGVEVWVQRNKSVGFACQSKLRENIFYNDVVIEVQ